VLACGDCHTDEMTRRSETLGLLLGFIGMVCFAGTLPAMRVAVPHLDPWFLTNARAVIAAIGGGALLLYFRRRVPPRQKWFGLAVASLCLVYGFPLASALAMQTVPVAHGGVVLGVLPLFTTLAATLVACERPSLAFWLVALAGAAVVVAFALRHGGGGALVGGDALLGVSIVAAAFGYTYAGKLSFDMPGWEVIAWALMISLPLALVATIWSWPQHPAAVPAAAWVALIYTAMISQLIGFFFWNTGLAMGGIARVGQIQLLQPFVIVLLATLVNGETIDAETLVFAVLVVATVMLGRRLRVKRKP
jgi:drug/metabolite transporter (DMT)-like permease